MREKLLEKVKKLINMERGAREINSPGEAMNFAQKAQELINKYQFSEEELSSLSQEENALEHEVIFKGHLLEWQQILLSGISETNNCIALFTPFCAMAIGTKHDRQIVRELFVYFNTLCRELMERERTRVVAGSINPFIDFSDFLISELMNGPQGFAPPPLNHSEHLRQFMTGLVCQITFRMAAEKKQAIADKKESDPESFALVVLDRKAKDAEAHLKKKFPWVEAQDKSIDQETFNSPAFQQGARKGEEIALTNKILPKE